jgi:hypothetical protein
MNFAVTDLPSAAVNVPAETKPVPNVVILEAPEALAI